MLEFKTWFCNDLWNRGWWIMKEHEKYGDILQPQVGYFETEKDALKFIDWHYSQKGEKQH